MNLSSRWCVTALVAFGALACSDPVPPPAQGALYTTISSVSPPPVGKACSAGASFTYDVPQVRVDHPTQILDSNTYVYKVIDGERSAKVSCAVRGSSTFTFSGQLLLNGEGFEVSNGTLDATHKGTARITVINTQRLSGALISPGSTCVIDAAGNGGGLQVQAGSMWASFKCPSVEAVPAESCAAEGFFVLENCAQ